MRFEEGRESALMRYPDVLHQKIKNESEARIIDNHGRGIVRVNAIIIVHEVDAAPSEKQRKTLSILWERRCPINGIINCRVIG